MNKAYLLMIAIHLSACNQQDSSISSAPQPKSNIQNIEIKEEYSFNYMGFSPCTKATREDILEIFKRNEAVNLKTTINSKFGLTSIKGKIGKGVKSIDLGVDLWNDRILAIVISDFYPKYLSEMNEVYGSPVDELDYITSNGNTIIKKIHKNPGKDVRLMLQTYIFRSEKLPPNFVFECIPLDNEYKISESKILGK